MNAASPSLIAGPEEGDGNIDASSAASILMFQIVRTFEDDAKTVSHLQHLQLEYLSYRGLLYRSSLRCKWFQWLTQPANGLCHDDIMISAHYTNR